MQLTTAGVGAHATDATHGAKSRPIHDHTRTRSRFVLAALAAALAVAALAPAIARALDISIEASIFVVASVAAMLVGWRSARALDALERRSIEDPVTRVGNRRLCEQQLAREVERARRSRMPLSLLVLDVDNLKKLNDAHGHVCGDRALAFVGDVLLAVCRSRDVPTRFGGDEFAVVLPRTRSGEARVVAERIRSEIARRRDELGQPLSDLLTVSIGVSDLDSADGDGPNALFEAADCALYAAKAAGRDRIEVKEPTRVSGVIRLDLIRTARMKGRASV